MKICMITILGIATLVLAGCQTAFVCGGMLDPGKEVITSETDE